MTLRRETMSASSTGPFATPSSGRSWVSPSRNDTGKNGFEGEKRSSGVRSCSSGASLLTLALHEPRTEHSLRLKLIVGSASETHSLQGRPSSACDRVDMIEFEESRRGAAFSARAYERAPPCVPFPHGAPNKRRYVTLATR